MLKYFLKSEEGSVNELTWQVGAAVVVVLIIVVFMVLGPDTAETAWNKFIDYALESFGL